MTSNLKFKFTLRIKTFDFPDFLQPSIYQYTIPQLKKYIPKKTIPVLLHISKITSHSNSKNSCLLSAHLWKMKTMASARLMEWQQKYVFKVIDRQHVTQIRHKWISFESWFGIKKCFLLIYFFFIFACYVYTLKTAYTESI